MARENAAHNVVIESLTEALLKLAETKPLSEINVSELCEKAGVSRVSFYRNFKSMEDILVKHLTQCTDNWWKDFSTLPPEEFHKKFWSALLDEYRKNKDLILLLYKNNSSHILKEHIFSCCMPKEDDNEFNCYCRAALAGAIYGMVDEWIKRGMNNIPPDFSLYKLMEVMPK